MLRGILFCLFLANLSALILAFGDKSRPKYLPLKGKYKNYRINPKWSYRSYTTFLPNMTQSDFNSEFPYKIQFVTEVYKVNLTSTKLSISKNIFTL